MKVFILTFCRNYELLYGSTLVFKTLRVGFPTAEVIVVDNCSVPEARPVIAKLAKENDCVFIQLKSEIKHAHNMNTVVSRIEGYKEKETVIFLDPDVVFWECCEDWDFSQYLFAGRLIPTYMDDFTQSLILARAHLSFLWIQDVGLLRHKIEEHPKRILGFDPFIQYTFRDTNGNWVYLDTGASLSLAFRDEVFYFGEEQLNCFDHILCGSYADEVASCLPVEDRKTFERHHLYARTDYTKLKGIWEEQDEYFKRKSKGNRKELAMMQQALDEGNKTLDEMEAESSPIRRSRSKKKALKQ